MADHRKVWRNGELIPWEDATVHILSHALSRGSAVFDVFGVHDTPDGVAAFRLDDHIRRLFTTTRSLGMELAQSPEELIEAVTQTVRANDLRRGFIKIVAYYGFESFAILVPEVKLDVDILAVPAGADLGLDLTKPIRACFSKWRKIHPLSMPPHAKACANYLNAMLIRQDALARGYDVGLCMDTHGFLAEGSIEGAFVVKDGVLMTAPLGRVLASVSRQSVLDAAGIVGIEAVEKAIPYEEVYEVDEMFVSSTPFKVLPVGTFEDRVFDPAPGPVTARLMALMADIMAYRDDRFKHWFQVLR